MKRQHSIKAGLTAAAFIFAVHGVAGAQAFEGDVHEAMDASSIEANKDVLGTPGVGSGFNYQGELRDGGSPANGQYDLSFALFDDPTGGTQIGSNQVFLNRTVSDGLFHIQNIDFGASAFTGGARWLRVTVRETGNPGSETTLSPRQRVSATPYAVQAEFLSRYGANPGDVLQWDGLEWDPVALGGAASQWQNGTAGDIFYTGGDVGIGTVNPFVSLHVVSTDAQTALFSGGDGMYVTFAENGIGRGYIGSYQTGAGTQNEDFEIGTFSDSIGSLHLVTGLNEPRLTVDKDGLIGINTTDPQADLMVDGTTDGDVFRVRVDASTKLYVDDNGGVSVGSYATPPNDGLRVAGDVQQPLAANGLMKFMAHVDCGASPTVVKSYNGVGSGAITASLGSASGSCIVDFPSDLTDRYWQVSAVYASPSSVPGTRGATCRILDSGTDPDKLRCERFNASTATLSTGHIMILVY